MEKQTIQPQSPKDKLDAFETYEDFLEYAQNFFDLEPEEYVSLFNVLIKLESLGQDPVEMLTNCRHTQGDCLDMIKFLMYVDALDLTEIKEIV